MLIQTRLGADDRAAHAAALAVQIFGRRVNDNIGAQRQRQLQSRGAKAVIHHQQRPPGPRDGGQFFYVGDLGQRV